MNASTSSVLGIWGGRRARSRVSISMLRLGECFWVYSGTQDVGGSFVAGKIFRDQNASVGCTLYDSMQSGERRL